MLGWFKDFSNLLVYHGKDETYTCQNPGLPFLLLVKSKEKPLKSKVFFLSAEPSNCFGKIQQTMKEANLLGNAILFTIFVPLDNPPS